MKLFFITILFLSPLLFFILLTFFLIFFRYLLKNFIPYIILPITNYKIKNVFFNTFIICYADYLKLYKKDCYLYYKILYKETLTNSELKNLNQKLIL